MKYVVVTTCSFITDAVACEFDDYEKAKEYLHDIWQDHYNMALAENIVGVDEKTTYHQDDYAVIRWDDDDCIEFHLTYIREPKKINGKDYSDKSDNIKYIDGIRVLRLYDGNWYCLFNDYGAYHTSHMNCYSLNAFEKWCEVNNVTPEMK